MNKFLQQLGELSGVYPYDPQFVETVRERVRVDCSKVQVHLHKRRSAQDRLVLAAREAIVAVYQETFPDSWFPLTLKPNWPLAACIIKGNKAVIEFSFSPETSETMGGVEIEPVEIQVQRAPPNILSRALQMFDKRDLKAEREREPAPVGTPDFRPELKLTAPIKTGSKVSPTAQKAAQVQPAKPKAKPVPARKG